AEHRDAHAGQDRIRLATPAEGMREGFEAQLDDDLAEHLQQELPHQLDDDLDQPLEHGSPDALRSRSAPVRPRGGYTMVRPPETDRVWPVTKSASADARKTTAPATSSGVPSRPHGIAFFSASASPGFPAVNSVVKSGVSDGPGQTQLTLIR